MNRYGALAIALIASLSLGQPAMAKDRDHQSPSKHSTEQNQTNTGSTDQASTSQRTPDASPSSTTVRSEQETSSSNPPVAQSNSNNSTEANTSSQQPVRHDPAPAPEPAPLPDKSQAEVAPTVAAPAVEQPLPSLPTNYVPVAKVISPLQTTDQKPTKPSSPSQTAPVAEIFSKAITPPLAFLSQTDPNNFYRSDALPKNVNQTLSSLALLMMVSGAGLLKSGTILAYIRSGLPNLLLFR